MSSHAGSKVSFRRKVLLSQYTTMQVGGPAEFFAEPRLEEELMDLLEYARQEKLPFFILGKGSNTVFPDEGYPGLVISLLQFEKNRILFDKKNDFVRASGGVFLYRFVLACRDQGLGGMEFLANIPGTMGGAVAMNAGFSRFPGQRIEIGDLIQEITVLQYDGVRRVITKPELCFTYRSGNLSNCVVIEAGLQLWHRNREDIEKEIQACFQFRNSKQDLRFPSSGSIFRNPPAPAPAAAALIDQLGLKGTRVGGMMVSEKHGNYFVNAGRGSASDLIQLVAQIQEKVFHEKGIWLEPEVRIVPKP